MSGRGDPLLMYPKNGGHQTAAFTSASAAIPSAVSAQTRRIAVYASADCHINVGKNPTATSSDFFLPSSVATVMAIRPGEKVAAIRAGTTDGTLHVSELDY